MDSGTGGWVVVDCEDNFMWDCRTKPMIKRTKPTVCKYCGIKETPTTFYPRKQQVCKFCRNERQKEANRKIRDEALVAYGNKCACCGIANKEFLAFDHINGGGKKHRETVGCGNTTGLLRFLRDAGYPPIVRLLCHNCNCARGFYGYCPHEKGKQ